MENLLFLPAAKFPQLEVCCGAEELSDTLLLWLLDNPQVLHCVFFPSSPPLAVSRLRYHPQDDLIKTRDVQPHTCEAISCSASVCGNSF